MARNAELRSQKLHKSDFTKRRVLRGANRLALLSAVGLALLLALFSFERRVQAAAVESRVEPVSWPVPDQPAEVEQPDDHARLAEALGLVAEDPHAGLQALHTLFRESSDPDVLGQVSVEIVAQDSDGFPGGQQGGFLRELAPAALLAARDSAVPPSVTMAQAILESGWGRSSVAQKANNLFGMKASRSQPGFAPNGGNRYRVFESWEESLRAHNDLLATSSRYAASREHTDDWSAFLRAIAPVYAASRSYVRLVSDLVHRYDLDRWDGLIRDTHQVLAEQSEVAVASADGAVTEP